MANVQKLLDFISTNVLPFGYLLAGIFVGIALGLGRAVNEAVPQDMHAAFSNLVKRSKVIIADIEGRAATIKKQAVERITNGKQTDPVKAAKAEAASAKKRVAMAINGKAVNGVHANGH